MSLPLLSARAVHKSFGPVHAVRDFDLNVRRGELFGLIGPDGAGKTTLMRMVVTLLRPDDGSILVDGHDVVSEMRHIRAITGYMPQRFSLYGDLSVEQNLHFFADLFEVPRAEFAARKKRLYEFSRLEPFAKRLAGRLSGGMKQKLALSCTLIHDPDLLLLDEPTTGVDPVSRMEFWTILRELRAQGITIVVSTPYMDEALLCDRVIIMHEGRALAEGSPAELIARHPWPMLEVAPRDVSAAARELAALPGVHAVQGFGDVLHVSARDEQFAEALHENLRALYGAAAVRAIEPTFEDVFIHCIEEEAHEHGA